MTCLGDGVRADRGQLPLELLVYPHDASPLRTSP